MNVIICGAGEVGRHAAEVLAAEAHDITILDLSAEKLEDLDESLDVRSMVGSGTRSDVLSEVGIADADLFIAATNVDEVNLLSASVAKGLGARLCIARVHHSAYFERKKFDYAGHLRIDHLVCPEYSTALAIAAALRSPGALAIERFAQGKIELQQLPVSKGAPAVGVPLRELKLPGPARLAAIERAGRAFLPEAESVLQPDDVVTLVGESSYFEKARRLFHNETDKLRRVMILGGTGQGVWLCRTLRDRGFSVRLFEANEARAIELSEKLEWVTVIHGDAIHGDVLKEERVDQVDAFVALTDDDERNILAAARAKAMGATTAIAVLQRGTYLHLLDYVGIDKAFSPRVTAVTEITRLLMTGHVRQLASLAEGIADVFEVTVTPSAGAVIGKPLRELTFPSRCIVVAIQRGPGEVFVPGAESTIEAGDSLVVIGPAEIRKGLRKLFGG